MQKLLGVCFKQLNKLKPTIHSCSMKMMEEIGELLQIYAKGTRASGELNTESLDPVKMIEEAADVAQSAVTMMYVIADEYDLDLIDVMTRHEAKLTLKGYLG